MFAKLTIFYKLGGPGSSSGKMFVFIFFLKPICITLNCGLIMGATTTPGPTKILNLRKIETYILY
jgi:hypothetical protein